jgi:hypothetical protein
VRPVVVRIGLAAAPVSLLALALAAPGSQLLSLSGAGDWGSDWRWLADGLNRLAAGQPLVRPEYVTAPFSQFPNGPDYTWSLHLPSTATLVAPSLLLPGWLRQPVWTWLMATTLLVAIWLAWPRRLWWGTRLIVAAVLLGPPVSWVSLGLVDQLHYANPNALVVLGLVITWIGRRHGSMALLTGGLVLAAVKIAPALGLVAWLIAGRGRDRTHGRPPAVTPAILFAAAILVALTLPVLAIDPGALADTISTLGNLVPWPGDSNLAPSVRLAPLLGAELAAWLSRAAGAALLAAVVVRRLDGPGGFLLAALAPLLLTAQLWAHWTLIPAVAALAAAGDLRPVRWLDRRLRLAWLGEAVTEAVPARRERRPEAAGRRPLSADGATGAPSKDAPARTGRER